MQKLKNELSNDKIKFTQKENMYKEQLNEKQKEIVKLQTKIKVLKTNNLFSHKNDISSNNNSNISMMIRTKANSSGYNISQEDLENNKYKFDELYTLYREQNNDNNIYINKNRTMSNIKPSRNNNYFTIVNKHSNKNNNLSQQNTIININSYLQKNFSSNSLRKNNSNNKKRKNYNNSSNKKRDLKQYSNNSNSLNITNNTYNMNKNSIMINLNPKNVNMNVEKLKVQKKLYEYQRLIDQKLNELIKNRFPHPQSKHRKYTLHVRQNSTPNIYISNSKRKNNASIVGLEYYLKKGKKKSITPNTIINNNRGNRNTISQKQITRVNMDSMKKRKGHQRHFSKSQSLKKNKSNSENISNMKQKIINVNFNEKIKEFNNSKQDSDNSNMNVKSNLSLRKFIFTKCDNPAANHIINE